MSGLIWVTNATNSSLNLSASTFSFQNAISVFPYVSHTVSTPFLFENGCDQGNGTLNCTASCLDKSVIFDSLDNLHNCMMYPAVAEAYAEGNLTANTTAIMEDFAIQKSIKGSQPSLDIINTIQPCLLDYCATLNGCHYDSHASINSGDPSVSNGSYYYPVLDRRFQCDVSYSDVFDICIFLPASVNPDIGGIGVYVSYWIQTGIALLSSISVIWFNWGVYYTCLLAKARSQGFSRARSIAKKVRMKYRERFLPSMASALIDFHKTQCFFMMAINIATQVNRSRGGFQPTNLQQLYNTYNLIKSISISGYLHITFTIFTLHMVDMVTGYLLVLSVCTIAVSIATLFTIGNSNPTQKDVDYLNQQAHTGGPDSCGKNNPFVYCLNNPNSGTYSQDPSSGANQMLGFCLVVLLLLIAHQCNAFKDPKTKRTKHWLARTRKYILGNAVTSLRLIHMIISFSLMGFIASIIDSFQNLDYYLAFDYYVPSNKPSQFILFTTVWTMLFLFYAFLDSMMGRRRFAKLHDWFFNRKAACITEWLTSIFWFGCIVAFASSHFCVGSLGAVCPLVLVPTNLAWITFVVTAVVSTLHLIRTRAGKAGEDTSETTGSSQVWLPPGFEAYRLQFNQVKSTLKPRIDSLAAKTSDTYDPDGLRLTSSLVFMLYLTFWVLYIYWFQVFCTDLAYFATNGVDFHSWSFGQVVAITIWAQPLCEYLHLELRGMTRGFEHRLLPPYKVVRQDDLDNQNSPDGDMEPGTVHNSSELELMQQEAAHGQGINYDKVDPPNYLAMEDFRNSVEAVEDRPETGYLGAGTG